MPVDIVTSDEKYDYSGGELKVAVLDFGLKRNIIRSLEKRGCAVTVFPARTNADEILSGGFDGLMLTNGPGDPKDNTEVINNPQKADRQAADIWDMPWAPAAGARDGRGYRKAEIRPQRIEPPCQRP